METYERNSKGAQQQPAPAYNVWWMNRKECLPFHWTMLRQTSISPLSVWLYELSWMCCCFCEGGWIDQIRMNESGYVEGISNLIMNLQSHPLRWYICALRRLLCVTLENRMTYTGILCNMTNPDDIGRLNAHSPEGLQLHAAAVTKVSLCNVAIHTNVEWINDLFWNWPPRLPSESISLWKCSVLQGCWDRWHFIFVGVCIVYMSVEPLKHHCFDVYLTGSCLTLGHFNVLLELLFMESLLALPLNDKQSLLFSCHSHVFCSVI